MLAIHVDRIVRNFHPQDLSLHINGHKEILLVLMKKLMMNKLSTSALRIKRQVVTMSDFNKHEAPYSGT